MNAASGSWSHLPVASACLLFIGPALLVMLYVFERLEPNRSAPVARSHYTGSNTRSILGSCNCETKTETAVTPMIARKRLVFGTLFYSTLVVAAICLIYFALVLRYELSLSIPGSHSSGLREQRAG